MNATKKNDLLLCEKVLLDTPQLAQMLSCGRATAIKIGEAAGARLQIGKRVLWNVKKVQKYLDQMAAEQAVM